MEGKDIKIIIGMYFFLFIFRITNSLKEFHSEVDVEASGSKMYFMISDNPAEKEESLTPVIRTVSSDYIFNSVLQCEFK